MSGNTYTVYCAHCGSSNTVVEDEDGKLVYKLSVYKEEGTQGDVRPDGLPEGVHAPEGGGKESQKVSRLKPIL